MRLIPRTLDISLPWIGGVTIDLSEDAAAAAWSLYLELVTRISREPLEKGQGSVREALTSLYHLFELTRAVLRKSGVDTIRATKGHESVGSIAIRVLNEGIRPHLVRWHTSLGAHEAATWKAWLESGKPMPPLPAVAAALVDESAWAGYDAFYDELTDLQRKLDEYVTALGKMAGIEQG